MSTRQALTAAAAENGWHLVLNEPHGQHWERRAAVPDDHELARMKRIAQVDRPDLQGVRVSYTKAGAIRSARFYDPGRQGLIMGQFVDPAEETIGADKRGQVLAWFARPAAFPLPAAATC